MAEKGSKKASGSPPKGDEEPVNSERPTVAPPFDVEAFARAATASGPPHKKTSDPAGTAGDLGSSRVDLQACKLEYSIVSPK